MVVVVEEIRVGALVVVEKVELAAELVVKVVVLVEGLGVVGIMEEEVSVDVVVLELKETHVDPV